MQRLTAVSHYKDDNGDRPTVLLYARRGKWFGLPRYYYRASALQSIAKTFIDKTISGKSIDCSFIEVDPDHPNVPDQRKLENKFRRIIEAGGTGVLLRATTGFGKTIVMLRFLCALGEKAIITVPKEDLIEQWIKEILLHTNIKRKEIGIIQQNKCEYENKKVVVAMMHSLTLRKKAYPKEMHSSFGTVIIDEGHLVGAEQLGAVSCMFPAKYRLVCSATPDRKDGMDDVLKYHIAQWRIGPEKDKQPKPKIFVKFWERSCGKLPPINNAMALRSFLITKLAMNPARNMAILNYAKAIFNKGRKVIIISERKAQLYYLRDMLKNGGVPENSIGVYVGGLSKEARASLVKNCSIFLATYGAMKIGTDVPSVSSLILATPQSSAVQIVGRIRRILEGKGQPVVVDIVDTSYKKTKQWYNSRRKDYESMGAEFVRLVQR